MSSFTVGRGKEADVQLEDDSVSRLHLSIRQLSPTQWEVEDLNSSNGTFALLGKQVQPITKIVAEAQMVLILGEYQTDLKALLEKHANRARPAPERPASSDNRQQAAETKDPYSRYIRSEDGRYVRKPK